MIRTGYLRWEIEAEDVRSSQDATAREVIFRARPSYRKVIVKSAQHVEAAQRFARGEDTYESVMNARGRNEGESELTIPDVGPRVFRYSEQDRTRMLRYWLDKLQREVSAFAHDVIRVASSFPQLVISNAGLRAGYARMVESEIFRVIEGKSVAQPTRDDEPMRVDSQVFRDGVPELVAAELVRDVVEPREFHEFCQYDCVTILNGDKYYRIPRRPHGLIEVWDAQTRRPLARLCIVFEDPGMPPSDEVVMKYLLAKHQPDILWQIGVRFSPPKGKFEKIPPRRWSVD
ncbi:MAG: hypothetical protein ABS79_05765 [Planctomycetes bacterium SCN 63-9]|nr:MAG: hypothetical protein ABS79_05765 [Planctomycetes bacterium SCN 63-9]